MEKTEWRPPMLAAEREIAGGLIHNTADKILAQQGNRLDPFPRQARYPLSQALEDGDLKSARAFLPEGFADQPLLTPAELVELARAISPKVKQLTEDMRPMVQ
ncbi:MAG: hypothetical protein VX293_03390 [Candidatus Latescibacterota bacterium]|nr:hypothetical protein [Candidatus Latescibacterota bacterium]